MNRHSSKYYKIYQKSIALIAIVAFVGSLFTQQVVKAVDNTISTSSTDAGQICALNLDENGQIITEQQAMKNWVLKRVADAGLDPKEANIIITCESRWNPDAMGFNTNHTADLGLWQINSIHKDISNADKLDYQKATDWAINKRIAQGHWLDWACSRKLARR